MAYVGRCARVLRANGIKICFETIRKMDLAEGKRRCNRSLTPAASCSKYLTLAAICQKVDATLSCCIVQEEEDAAKLSHLSHVPGALSW